MAPPLVGITLLPDMQPGTAVIAVPFHTGGARAGARLSLSRSGDRRSARRARREPGNARRDLRLAPRASGRDRDAISFRGAVDGGQSAGLAHRVPDGRG